MRVKRTAEERFHASYRVDDNGCWIWQGHLSSAGYSRFSDNGDLSGHRWSYRHFRGPIPTGLHIDHLCRNRACVNPAHLEAVTRRVNILRGEAPPAQNARKTHCNYGHPLEGDNLYIARGGRRRCRECMKRACRRMEHTPKRLASNARYRETEQYRERTRRYRETHRAEMAAYQRAWKRKQRDRLGVPRPGSPKGMFNGQAKLTDEQVLEIRRLYAAGGVSMKALGERFGCSTSTIHSIVNRRRWQHL